MARVTERKGPAWAYHITFPNPFPYQKNSELRHAGKWLEHHPTRPLPHHDFDFSVTQHETIYRFDDPILAAEFKLRFSVGS